MSFSIEDFRHALDAFLEDTFDDPELENVKMMLRSIDEKDSDTKQNLESLITTLFNNTAEEQIDLSQAWLAVTLGVVRIRHFCVRQYQMIAVTMMLNGKSEVFQDWIFKMSTQYNVPLMIREIQGRATRTEISILGYTGCGESVGRTQSSRIAYSELRIMMILSLPEHLKSLVPRLGGKM